MIPIRHEIKVPQPSSPTHTNVADEAAYIGMDVRHERAATTVSSLDAGQGSGNINKTPSMPHDSPLPGGHTSGSDEGRMQHNELMDLVTKLSNIVLVLETDLQQTKKIYSTTFTKLIMKVKRLEKVVKLNKARRRAKIVVSDDEDAEKDTSKQGRSMIKDIDLDARVTLVQIDVEDQESAAKVLADAARVHTYSRRRRIVSISSDGINTSSRLISIAGMVQESIHSSSASIDKGKAIMTESEPEQTTKKLKQRQERAGYE
ncbi:hypothetical protein Tco_0142575, partial [Tanacetum coccineum]